MIDPSEINERLMTDWGETWTVNGSTVTGTFAPGGANRDENPHGIDIIQTAAARFDPDDVPDLKTGDVIVRRADTTYWRVTILRTINGLTAVDLQRVSPVALNRRG